MTGVQLLVMAKAPLPGRVKTRLCPPCTPQQAAALAAAALADTLATGGALSADRRTLVLAGGYDAPCGWRVTAQRGDGLGERLAHAFADTADPALASVLVGMDTPQVTVDLMSAAGGVLAAGAADAVLGPAYDGGWWLLGLRDPVHATALRAVPMSTPYTGAATLQALRRRGLRVALLPQLRDVDTIDDMHAVAPLCPPGSHFAAAVARLPQPVAAR